MKFDHAPFNPYISTSVDSEKFLGAPATRDAIARQNTAQPADAIGGRGYSVDFAGEGTSEAQWDFLISMARLLQTPDLFSGDWVNSGGHYDKNKGEWFNTEGATGIPIDVLRGVVVGRIMELGLEGETVYRYVTRRDRTVAEEERFFNLSFESRMQALRTGAAL
jgi:hypothetical protein